MTGRLGVLLLVFVAGVVGMAHALSGLASVGGAL